MTYTTDSTLFQQLVEAHARPLRPGKALYLEGVGRKSSAGEITPDQMIEQLEIARQQGAVGAFIFHLGALTPEDFEKLHQFTAR